MAESPEHLFLKSEFLKVLNDFSSTKIYGYTEGNRKKFDMSCSLKRDWERPLVGQTMWGNETGLDKDLRMLVTATDADIWTYVIKDTVKNRASLHEVVQDYKNSKYRESLFKLKVFWIPNDFDADKDKERETVGRILKNAVVDDLLFNVVFGNLTTHDFIFFIRIITGIVGLPIAILSHIAIFGLGNYVLINQVLGVSKGPIREKMGQLQAKGFLTNGNGLDIHISLKGRVLLSIIKRIGEEYETGKFSDELIFILSKLGQQMEATKKNGDTIISLTDGLKELLEEYYAAKKYSEFSLDETKFVIKGDN